MPKLWREGDIQVISTADENTGAYKQEQRWQFLGKDYDDRYVYQESKHSRRGIMATLLGSFSLFILLVLVWISIISRNGAGIISGAVGFAAFTMAFIGLIRGLGSFRDSCRSYFFSKLGTLLCGFLVASWFLVYCVGIG